LKSPSANRHTRPQAVCCTACALRFYSMTCRSPREDQSSEPFPWFPMQSSECTSLAMHVHMVQDVRSQRGILFGELCGQLHRRELCGCQADVAVRACTVAHPCTMQGRVSISRVLAFAHPRLHRAQYHTYSPIHLSTNTSHSFFGLCAMLQAASHSHGLFATTTLGGGRQQWRTLVTSTAALGRVRPAAPRRPNKNDDGEESTVRSACSYTHRDCATVLNDDQLPT
jgi:hypothetical protein